MPLMPKASHHLPTEIVIDIARALYECRSRGEPEFELLRQRDMYSFCLVSLQWYYAGLPFLYRNPQLFGGNRFAHFTRTVCPPPRERQPTRELGSMVEILRLELLVHHSSNSVTARLLNRTQKSLREFIAPCVSFGVNGLSALAKCHQLVFVNLGQVDPRYMSFTRLKKAVSHLHNLQILHLPTRMVIDRPDSTAGKWPPNLRLMRLGGCHDPDAMRNFDWPPALSDLVLSESSNLNTAVIESILQNEQLASSLTRLCLLPGHKKPLGGPPTYVLFSLPHLTTLEMPLSLLPDLKLLNYGPEALPIRELIFLSEDADALDNTVDYTGEICEALHTNLRNLFFLSIPRALVSLWTEEMVANMDETIMNHLDEANDDELEDIVLEGLGLRVS